MTLKDILSKSQLPRGIKSGGGTGSCPQALEIRPINFSQIRKNLHYPIAELCANLF